MAYEYLLVFAHYPSFPLTSYVVFLWHSNLVPLAKYSQGILKSLDTMKKIKTSDKGDFMGRDKTQYFSYDNGSM